MDGTFILKLLSMRLMFWDILENGNHIGYWEDFLPEIEYRDDYYELFASNVFGMMGFYTPFVYLPNMAQQYVSIVFFICN